MNEKDVYGEIEKYRLLLQKYFEETLEPEERRQLAVWLWADRKNRDLLVKLRGDCTLHDRFKEYEKMDAVREFELLIHRYDRVKQRRMIIRWSGVAAVLIIALCAIPLFRLSDSQLRDELVVKEGKLQAVLTTADGNVISIQEKMSLRDLETFQIRDSVKELICGTNLPVKDSLRYNRLEVPRGGEYTLVLADGSCVRLSSESSIRFPESFSDSLREVEIEGEAYLEVKKDSTRPFIVHVKELKIEVLGTRFGVRVYQDDSMASTTLAEGRVRVVAGKSKVVLVPGEQAYWTEGKLRKREVDVNAVLAWVDGLFVFEHDELSYVINQLSRWYDVEFRFKDEKLKEFQFTGTVNRDEGLDGILNLMERMNVVSFEKRNGYIWVKENDKVKAYN